MTEENNMTTLTYAMEDAIREVLLGRKVVAAEQFADGIEVEGAYDRAEGKLTLDDGRELFVVPNIGGCSCSSGDDALDSLNRVDNIITRVDFEVEEHEGDEWQWREDARVYRIFVLAGHETINLLSVSGDDGNGYYGTGYELVVVDRSAE